MKGYSMYGMAGVGIAAAIGFIFALSSLGGTLTPPDIGGGPEIFQNETAPTIFTTASQALKKFASVDELKSYLLNVEANRGQLASFYGGDVAFGVELRLTLEDAGQDAVQGAPMQAQTGDVDGAVSADKELGYSTTNVQVEGVDEPDFLKNDGKYVYILSGDRLTIVDAYPAENASVTVKVALDIGQGQYLQNMFLNNDTLVIFYQEYSEDFVIQQYDFAPQPVYQPKTHAMLLDVSDRENPEVLNDYEVSGNYNNARMTGETVYLITTSDLYDYRSPIIPLVSESSRTVVRPDIYYFDNPELYFAFNTVTSIDIAGDTGQAVNSTSFLMNPASTVYMSEDNIYIAYQKNQPYYYQTNTKDRFFEAVVPLLPEDVQEEIDDIENNDELSPSEKWDRVSELLQDTYNRMSEADKNKLFEDIRRALAEYDERIAKETQTTVIHKIGIGSGGINYDSKGEVPGRLLNQFSMDESGDRFRVATTSEFYSPYRGTTSLYNNVYVLDGSMKIVGKLEEVARDESIYSARFMGDRLYLVTFQRIDPFFVIDLSEDDPKVLGELKLPGYSNYLHPYDKDHIIGIGKETKENQYGGIETLGVKVALFDVSDVRNPQVVDVYEIGGSGTDSEVLYDHKALLFDRSKNVLSIPVSIYPDYSVPPPLDDRIYEPKVWRGFYVFGVDPDAGFTLKGKVEHFNDTGDYYYIYGTQGSRSFYIGDVLYTMTLNNVIKMNDLKSLDEINELEIGPSGGIIKSPTIKDGAQ